MAGAPRLTARAWRCVARGVLLAVCLWPGLAAALEIAAASYDVPTRAYGHLVLGKDHNWSTLSVTLSDGSAQRITLADRVFEDTAPRLVDMDGDGAPEIFVVEAKSGQGARAAFYRLGSTGRVSLAAATPYIGTGNRWLAPVGVADFDGDGAMEFAYVDRPHLAKTLRVWRWATASEADVRLTELTMIGNITNHRIGEDWISGGVRDCGSGPEMLVSDATWTRMLAVRLHPGAGEGARLSVTPLGRDTSRAAFARALACT